MRRRRAGFFAALCCGLAGLGGGASVGAAPSATPPRVLAPRLAAPSSDAAPPASAHGLGLSRQRDGRYRYADPGRRFTARIELDGSVRFADRWRRIDERPRRRRSQRGRAGGRPPEGTLAAADPFGGAAVTGPSEWALRARRHDPSAAAKAAWLSRTEAFRARLALAWHREQLRVRLATLPDRLTALWEDTTRPEAERRRLLFAQWDECAQPLPVAASTPATAPVLDRERAKAAAIAREVIERFVRETLPVGSPHAYSTAELDRLNAVRDSDERFAPYAGAPAETTKGT